MLNYLIIFLVSMIPIIELRGAMIYAVGFDLPAICVDVHVHRICNWLELVKTKKPVETEMKLREILPVRYWKTWNSHLVSFGQTRCDPVRPKCAGCPIARFCHSPKKKA